MQASERLCFSLFRGVVKAIGSTLNLQEVMDTLVNSVVQAMDLKGCAVRLLDPTTRHLVLLSAHGLSERYVNKGPLEADQSIVDALKGQTVWIRDAKHDPRIQYQGEAAEEGIGSIVSVPLVLKGRVIGVLRLYSAQPRDFSPDEIDLAEAVAEIGAITIENARLHEEALHKSYFDTFVKVTKAMSSTLEIQKVMDTLVQNLVQVMGVKASAIRLLNPHRATLDLLASYGLSDRYIRKGTLSADRSIAETQTGGVVIIRDAGTDPRVQYQQEAIEEGIAGIVSIPLSLRDRIIGVVRLYTAEPRDFSVDELHFAQTLAEMGAIAIENARLYETVEKNYESVTADLHSLAKEYYSQ